MIYSFTMDILIVSHATVSTQEYNQCVIDLFRACQIHHIEPTNRDLEWCKWYEMVVSGYKSDSGLKQASRNGHRSPVICDDEMEDQSQRIEDDFSTSVPYTFDNDSSMDSDVDYNSDDERDDDCNETSDDYQDETSDDYQDENQDEYHEDYND